MATRVYAIAMLLMCFTFQCVSQETVFALLRKDVKLADDYFSEGAFQNALLLYENSLKKDPISDALQLKMARCYYHLKKFGQAVTVYEKLWAEEKQIPVDDIVMSAESYAAIRNYKKAIEWYKRCLTKQPDNDMINKKIWQLSNIHFLLEDSLHFVLRPIRSNSNFGELCAKFYDKGIVFLSNRTRVQVVQKIDGTSDLPYYQLYYSRLSQDTVKHSGMLLYEEPVTFDKDFNTKYHQGPVSFYANQKKMVYVSTGRQSNEEGKRTLQLFFAERVGNRWKYAYDFPYNSAAYSISDVTISEDGKVLYFSSDMKGGLGGKDIYKSIYANGQWSKPQNVGDAVNTSRDEVFPFLQHNQTLYFSSDGHPGLGGLDVFKTEIIDNGFGEISNIGYPLNTNFDEFGITLDSLSTFGYLSSNRKNGGTNDDIFEFDIDLQTYPLVINGHVKFKDVSWSDSLHTQPLPNAKLYLIDNVRNVLVHESSADATGKFSLQIPYFSKYKIRIIAEDKEENFVSLEIPKHRKEESEHELVVVRDPFKVHDHISGK